MSSQNRPLSPHLQIYRPQLTSMLSILHRISGVGLSVGTLLLVTWLVAIAAGAEAYQTVELLIRSFIGRLLLFGWTLALFYHLLNGIRHLFWDMGAGLELPEVYRSGAAVVIATLGFTVLSWILGYAAMGAF